MGLVGWAGFCGLGVGGYRVKYAGGGCNYNSGRVSRQKG